MTEIDAETRSIWELANKFIIGLYSRIGIDVDAYNSLCQSLRMYALHWRNDILITRVSAYVLNDIYPGVISSLDAYRRVAHLSDMYIQGKQKAYALAQLVQECVSPSNDTDQEHDDKQAIEIMLNSEQFLGTLRSTGKVDNRRLEALRQSLSDYAHHFSHDEFVSKEASYVFCSICYDIDRISDSVPRIDVQETEKAWYQLMTDIKSCISISNDEFKKLGGSLR